MCFLRLSDCSSSYNNKNDDAFLYGERRLDEKVNSPRSDQVRKSESGEFVVCASSYEGCLNHGHSVKELVWQRGFDSDGKSLCLNQRREENLDGAT